MHKVCVCLFCSLFCFFSHSLFFHRWLLNILDYIHGLKKLSQCNIKPTNMYFIFYVYNITHVVCIANGNTGMPGFHISLTETCWHWCAPHKTDSLSFLLKAPLHFIRHNNKKVKRVISPRAKKGTDDDMAVWYIVLWWNVR